MLAAAPNARTRIHWRVWSPQSPGFSQAADATVAVIPVSAANGEDRVTMTVATVVATATTPTSGAAVSSTPAVMPSPWPPWRCR
jgi:hypothetical protein